MKKSMKITFLVLLGIAVLILIVYFVTNQIVKRSGHDSLFSLEEAENQKTTFQVDAILVLGAGVRPDGSPSNMLEDRLITCTRLYQSGACDKIIVSGDHSDEDYDEVGTMKEYLIDAGVPSEAVFMDHAGFSTYDSLYRAKAIFGANSVLIITQEYHTYRALFIGKSLGMDCEAVSAPILSSDSKQYPRQAWFSFRETIARSKDFFVCLYQPVPKNLGEPISLENSGDETNRWP